MVKTVGAPALGSDHAPQKLTTQPSTKPHTQNLLLRIVFILCKALYKYEWLRYIIYINAGDV